MREVNVAQLAGGVIVSCQPVPGGPTDGIAFIRGFALAARDGGARGLRIEGAGHVAAVVAACDLPVIGLVKRDLAGSDVRITPLLADVAALAEAGAGIIAVDATRRARPEPVAALIAAIRARGRLAMADCSDLEDARAALSAGAAIIGTTMAGYTGGPAPALPDLALVRAAAALGAPVFAEGRYHTPALAARAIEAGACAVVVGSAVTRPEHITRWFADAVGAAAAAAPAEILALDIGGTKSSAALIRDGRVLRRVVLPTRREAGPDDWLAALAEATDGWPRQGVAAAVSGVVREGIWSAANPGTLPVPAGYPLVARLRAAFGAGQERLPALALPALALNDAQAAAWGEFRFGAGQGRDMAFVTLSSGIGGGLVLGGRLIEGHGGLAGSLGQMPFPGERLEELASGLGLARAGGRDAATLFAATDAAARRDVAAFLHTVARGLGALQAMVDPAVIVLGGGIGLAAGVLERLDAAGRGLAPLLRPRLARAELGADGGLIGAADRLARVWGRVWGSG